MQNQVILRLIMKLGRTNSDYEQVLNSQTILVDLAESEFSFSLVIQKENLENIIYQACDNENENQAYALHILTTISKQYGDYEKEISRNLSNEFSEIMA